jgi:hypothetical protein
MDEPLTIGDHVVMSKKLPGKSDRADHVGTVEGFDGDVVLIRWAGPDAPQGLARFNPKALERWDG